MRFAYADPPYVGQAKKHYDSSEVNHQMLIGRLADEFRDGWALSCSSPSLPMLLTICPEGVRIGAWVKPFASFKPGVNPAYAWEPVIFAGGRSGKNRIGGRKALTVRDWHSANITLKKGLSGAKPKSFCFWVFELLGMTPEDEFADLFPGTGAVTNAWHEWKLAYEQP